MRDLVVSLLVGLVSALLPVVNVEAYLGVQAAVLPGGSVWLLGLAAAVGQMVGKLAWYYLGASSLNWRWVRRGLEKPKARARLARWQERTHDRPVYAGAVVLVSALTGLPPFAILSVVAGQLRMNLSLFLVLGLVGRWLRFVAILGGVGWMEAAGMV